MEWAESVGGGRLLVAVLPEAHPLAGGDTLPLEELADEDWVLFRRSDTPEMTDQVIGLCRAAGFSPRVVDDPAMMQTLLMMVAGGVGVSVSPYCIRSFGQPGVRFVPLRHGGPTVDLVAAREQGELPPTAAAFLSLLREHIPRIRVTYEAREI